MRLSEIIIQRIREKGPVSFCDFMDMALYYPGLGYYTSPKEKIGFKGDYFTSCTLTPLFGYTLATQLLEMWEKSGEHKFTIVEYGAGTGDLCRDILSFFNRIPEKYENLDYCIIEKSRSMCKKEREKLNDKVKWYENIQQIGELKGCVLSNELVDNFPVHKVVMEEELMEVFVDYKDGFKEVLVPARKELKAYLDELTVQLPKGFHAEINLAALDWIRQIGNSLKKGYVLTIDYGYPSAELYCDNRKHGTLTCYHRHVVNDQPYHSIGEQDITAHVNFSALCLWGNKYGLDYCGYRNQSDFLLALGLKDHLRKMRTSAKNFTDHQKEAFISNTFLGSMGNKFKVLIQKKAIDDIQLIGLRPLEA